MITPKNENVFYNIFPQRIGNQLKVGGQVIRVASLLIALSVLATTINYAQEPSSQTLIEKTERYVQKAAGNLEIPAAALALVKDGKVVHTAVFGKAPGQDFTNNSSSFIPISINFTNLRSNENILNGDTPFLIGSISKTLTAYGVLKLVDEGVVALDDPAQKYLPSIDLSEIAGGDELTLSHLLTHQSGIDNYIGMKYAELGLTDEDAVGQAIQLLFTENLIFQPGERFEYSPANYLLLAGIIEAATGETYSGYMKEHVFRPLGMEHSAASKKEITRLGLVQGYQSWFGRPIPVDVSYDNSGAAYGYIAASIRDMGAFLATLQKEDEIRARMVKSMVETSEYTAYGLGIRSVDIGKSTLTGHGGANANYRSAMWLTEGTDWGFVLLTNKNHVFEEYNLMKVSTGIANIIMGNDPEPVQKSTPAGIRVFLAVVIILIPATGFWWYGIYTNKITVNNKWFWGLTSVLLTVLTLGLIPLLLNIVGFPWHTLWLFIPDIMFTVIILNLIFLINAGLSIRYYLVINKY